MAKRLIVIGADFAANGLVAQLEHEYHLSTDVTNVDVPRGTTTIYIESYMATYNDDVFIGSTPADVSVTADGGLLCTVGEPIGNKYPIIIDGSAATNEKCTITVAQPASGKYIIIAANATIYAIKASTNAAVMDICHTQGWAANPEYMTFAEAAAVTYPQLETTFRESDIVSFDELQYFTGLARIPASAFRDCASLMSIKLPSSVTYIANSAFMGCAALDYIYIPRNVEKFDTQAFSNVKQGKIVEFEDFDELFRKASFVNLFATPLANRSLPYHNGERILSYTLPSDISTIPQYVLSGVNIDKLIFPDNIISIPAQSIMNATIREIEIGNGVQEIGNYAFAYATEPATITINASTPPTCGTKIFNGKNPVAIYVPDDSVTAYKAATGWLDYADYIQPLSTKIQNN